MIRDCTLVLPCRDEEPALRALLPTVPAEFDVVVVDNGSRDETAAVATELGARVIHERRPGYGSAVHAGVLEATTKWVAVMDADGSLDPVDLLPLLEDVRAGGAAMAVGRRRPTERKAWPAQARAGNALAVFVLRRRTAMPLRDISPMRVCGRQALLDLDVRDRRFGYPVELMRKAAVAGWHLTERDVAYRPRATGTASKVSGSLAGTVRTARDFSGALR